MSNVDFTIAPPAVPANSGTAVLLNTTYGLAKAPTAGGIGVMRGVPRAYKRAVVTIYANQDMTFKHNTLSSTSSTWRTQNGGGSGETVPASTPTEFDVLLYGHDNELTLTAGATAPTTFEVTIRLVKDRALGQP